jgi:hypothetical protein
MDKKKITKPIIPLPHEALVVPSNYRHFVISLLTRQGKRKNGMWAGKLKEQDSNVIAGQFEPYGDIPGNSGGGGGQDAINIREIRAAQSRHCS